MLYHLSYIPVEVQASEPSAGFGSIGTRRTVVGVLRVSVALDLALVAHGPPGMGQVGTATLAIGHPVHLLSRCRLIVQTVWAMAIW